MTKATKSQIIEVAKTCDAVGFNGVCLYGVVNGDVKKFAVSCYRDSLANLMKIGVLKYNGDYTYSLAR
jgi:riboflavin synthase alpha subunit